MSDLGSYLIDSIEQGLDLYHKQMKRDLKRISRTDKNVTKKPRAEMASKSLGVIRRHEGFIYLIKSSAGIYKIGRSKSPQRRLTEHQREVNKWAALVGVKSIKLTLVWSVKTKDMLSLEKLLLGAFSDMHINNEWHKFSAKDVARFKRLAKKHA